MMNGLNDLARVLPIRLRGRALILFAAAATLLLFLQTAHGAMRPATDTDRTAIEAAGLTYVRGMLWDPSNAYAGEEVAAAKAFLLSRYVIGPRSAPCIRTKEHGIGPLNFDFAIRVALMLQDMEKEVGGRNIVRSAYRPRACGGGVGHSGGCAIDVEWASSGGWRNASDNPNVRETQWILRNGSNPKYRIHFPFRFAPEWHHIEPMDRAGCLAGRKLDPSAVGAFTTRPPVQTAPSSGFAQALRNYLNPQPQPKPPTQSLPQQQQPRLDQLGQQPPALDTQNATPHPAGTCVPQFHCTNGAYYYRSSTCVDQIYQKCSAGCASSGNTCASTTTSSSLSTFDQIGLIAEPTSTPTGAVSDLLFELAIGGEEAAILQDKGPRPDATSQTDYGSALPLSQQTFVSQDLRYSSAPPYSVQQPSNLQRTLTLMKDILLRAIAYLRPFGRSSAGSADYDEGIE